MNSIPLVRKLLGSRDDIEYDRYFLTMVCFTATIFLLLLCLFHIVMSLKVTPAFIAGGSSLLLFVLYLLLRFGKCLIIPKLMVSVLGLLLLDLTWYAKFLSLGPVLFFIFAFGALIVWAWDNKALWIMLTFYFLNILALFYIEYTSSEFAFEYKNLAVRTKDIYLSFTLYSGLLFFILYWVKGDFMRQKENAIKSDKLKSAFLANLSHEIRTPMNSIVGFSNLLEFSKDESTTKKYIHNIQTSSECLLRLIDEILDLSKIEAGYTDVLLSDFKIADLFDELKEIHQLELVNREKNSIEIVYTLPETDLAIRSDYLRIKQVLSILLNNAIKFSTKGTISYNCIQSNGSLIFSVTDEGPGIEVEDQEKIFERFTRLDCNGINTEGSGIGLAIARKIVELLGGKIWINSRMEEGTTFFFSIPFTENRVTQITEKRLKKTENRMETKQNRSVLVVEDDNSSFQLIKEVLQSLNIEIHRANDGEEAIQFIKDSPHIKVVLMDIRLPKINGYEATKVIKKMVPGIVIIAQTAYAMPGDREKALEAGCDEYITKPLKYKELREMVVSYLAQN